MSEMKQKLQQIDELIITLEAKKQKVADEYRLIQRNIDELARQGDKIETLIAKAESVTG